MATTQSWHEPARGTLGRRDLAGALRPLAEWMPGAPVRFAITELRVGRGAGFAALTPRWPGGAPIDLRTTPMVPGDNWAPAMIGAVAKQVLYAKSGAVWGARDWVVGASDVWYDTLGCCAMFFAVIPQVCGNWGNAFGAALRVSFSMTAGRRPVG